MKKGINNVLGKVKTRINLSHAKRNAAAAVAVMLTAAVVTTSVLSRTQAAENADTLMGIEKLRNRIADGGEYTVLEIVPDINAAEIGYLFDGYEPILSEWDAATMSWKSWKDILCGMDNKEERRAFIYEKREALQAYYDKFGLKDNVPIDISNDEYDDSAEYIEGYDEVEAGSYDMNGYFVSTPNNVGKYYASFEYIGGDAIADQTDTVYYNLSNIREITEGLADYIADGVYIYKKDGSMYQCVGTWGSVKDNISFPSSSVEEGGDETGDGDKDNNGGNTGDNSGEEEGGNTGDNSGDEEGGNTGDNSGNEEGGNTGDNSGDENSGNAGDSSGSDGTGSGSEADGNSDGSGASEAGGNSNGSGTSADSGNSGSAKSDGDNGAGGGSDSAVNPVNTGTKSAAVGKSFSQVKWSKFVSTTDEPSKASGGSSSDAGDSKKTDSGNSGSGSGNNAGDSQSGGSGDNGGDSQGSGSGDNSGDNSGSGSGDNSGDNSGSGSRDNSGDNSGSGSGDNSGDNQGSGSGDNSGDSQSGGSGDNSGDNSGSGSGDNSGDNQGGTGDNSGDNQGGGSGDNSGDNQGGGSGDNSGDNQGGTGDNSGDNQGDGSDNEGDNPDGDPNKASDKSDRDSGNDSQTPQNADLNAGSEQYYLVYFDRITDVSLLNNGAYVVTGINPAKFSSYSGEDEHYTGQYNFVEEEGENTQTYTFPGRVLYCKGVFHSNEWFKHYALNMNKDNYGKFKVKVITLTPGDLNNIYLNGTNEYEQGSIPDFDFLYLNSGLRALPGGDTQPVEPQSGKEGDDSGNGGNTGADDESGNTGDENKPDEDITDDGTDGKPGEDGTNDGTDNKPSEDGTSDGTDNKPGEDGTNDGTGSKPGEDGNSDGTDNKPSRDETNNGTDNKPSGGGTNDGTDNKPEADSNKTLESNDGGSADSGSKNSNAESDKNTENAAAASINKSAWRTYVSNEQSDDAQPSSDSKKGTDKSDSTGNAAKDENAGKNTGDSGETSGNADNTSSGNTGYANNTGNTDNTDSTGSADNTGDADNTNGTGNAGDSDNTGDTPATDAGDNSSDSSSEDGDNTNNGDNANNGDNTDDGDNADDGSKTDADSDKSDESEPSATKQPSSAQGRKDSASIAVYNTGNNDLEKNVANLIFTRISAKALPCLVDGSILYGKAESGAITNKGDEAWANTENTGIFRLAAMLCQETLEKDYTGVSKEKLLEGIVDDADKNFTTEQVYCRLGNGSDSIINDNFFKYTIYKEGGEIEEGFQNVLDEINLENLYRESDSSGSYRALPTNISQAEALRHILNYQNRRNVETKKSIKVLEIQPAYTTEPEITKKQLQKWAPGVEEVETTIMTTAEFIGKIDKINEIYDLIYIGTSKEHLNLKNWVTDTGKSSDGKYLGSTVFNDKDMDGLIYYNVGDKRVVNLPMSGLLDSEYKNGRTYYYNFARYSGNDITKEKKDALISFLNGSYPVIVSDEFIEQPATVFEDEDYSGRRATLGVGEYTQQDLLDNQIYAAKDAPAKGISSIQVKKGYKVTLFAEDNFEGEYATFESDVNNLTKEVLENGQTWNNRCRSMIVEKVEDAQPVRALDGNHIDNSSYVYEFADKALDKGYTNFYVKGDIDENGSELLKFYLNRPKAKLKDFSANGMDSSQAGAGTQINDVYYIYPNYLGKYTLQFNFTIQNEGAASMDTRYDCKLYIDVNADGKFSDFEEVSDISVLNRSSGGGVAINELYAGVPYTVVRDVPGGYKGLLPWKIEICQVNNDNIYASQKGYTKLSGMEKETLRICQINKYIKSEDKHKVIDLTYEVNTKGRYFNTLVYGGDYGGVHYAGISEDFDLDIDTIDVPTFESYYDPASPAYNPDYLNGFNMLILGFSDAYDDFSGNVEDGNTPLGAVVDFIDSGKSVLMAHDTTSYWNNPIVDGKQQGYTERNSNDLAGLKKPESRFAANINKYIRPLVGMDRYGVLSSATVKKGASLKDGDKDWSNLFSSGKEVAYRPKSARKETVPEAQGFTSTIISVRDTDAEDKEKRDYTKYNLYSGNYNDRSDFSNTYVSQRFDDCYYDENTSDNGEINSANTSGKVKNVHVTQVNQGQITEYPYKLKEDFEVAQTHAQYYQLDYTADDDGDGQSDLVVWYCLGGRTSDTKSKQTTIYSQSPNDVRNNYYIYNKGNITYTGMGHGGNDNKKMSDKNAYTFEEAKLFINTMIASYQAGVKPPSITILESGRQEAAPLTTMYRYYDEANMISLADKADNGNYEKVYFTVRDVNFVKGVRVIASHAYYQADDGSETISVGGEDISVNPLADLIYDAETDTLADAYNLSSGGIYYLLVPRAVMSQCENGLDIYFEAQSTVTTNTNKENVYTTDKVYAKLQVLRAYLFELD